MLDRLSENEFIWRPYNMDWPEIVALPEECGIELWRCSCPLIHYSIVEELHVERVTRQFGIMQCIPPNPSRRENQRLHKLTRQGRGNHSWTEVHATYITKWYLASENEIVGHEPFEDNNVVEEYYRWYITKTRIRVSPPHPISTSGCRPDNPEMWTVVENGLAHLMDDYISISTIDYNNPGRIREMVESHKEVVPLLQDVIARRRTNIESMTEQTECTRTSGSERRSERGTNYPPGPSNVAPSVPQWATPTQPHDIPYIPTFSPSFNEAGPSNVPYTPHYFLAFDGASSSQVLQFYPLTVHYQPEFGHTPVPFNLSENMTPEAKPQLRRTARDPQSCRCFTGGHYGHHVDR